ncbi:MAG: cyclopropane-fatty-acyl-phospholipid synthase family protein [Pseudomonadota bacterium]|nr:cyclopropane-fatty-acyl-phospholipid synthase family protein [Pseudomonadota bacterium]
MGVTQLAISGIEQGLVPDSFVRAGIRRLLRERLVAIHASSSEDAARSCERFIAELAQAPIALVPEKANEQHYELPADFFAGVLGAHRKYSSCYWPDEATTLDEAEAAGLSTTCQRAQLGDGLDILELGCGWGSLTLWMGAHYPGSRITAVSNSQSQRAFIEAEASRRGLRNVEVITADMNGFDIDRQFDRVVSIEMFEHMRNWPALFGRVRSWLRPQGRFFMHVFVHRSSPYAFVEQDDSDWMSRHFFSGGMMPSDDLASRFQDDLRLLHRWRWNGSHYERTSNAWLTNMDARRATLWPIIEATYGREHAAQWWSRWRVFFMSCAELFGYNGGEEWWVAHYLFEPRT